MKEDINCTSPSFHLLAMYRVDPPSRRPHTPFFPANKQTRATTSPTPTPSSPPATSSANSPSALILSSNRVPPRVWLPGCVFAWGVLTLGLACEWLFLLRVGRGMSNETVGADRVLGVGWVVVHDVKTVWGIRFVQGVFEASTFSGTHFILGSWCESGLLNWIVGDHGL